MELVRPFLEVRVLSLIPKDRWFRLLWCQSIPRRRNLEGRSKVFSDESCLESRVSAQGHPHHLSEYAHLRSNVKAVSPKCLGGLPVDHDRLNAHPGPKGYLLSDYPPAHLHSGTLQKQILNPSALSVHSL
ncbi:hypothetical protein TNCV_2265391 [Trichonephila clavipes]|nr:hypothetical protein TNCV_2265391 [Trichonephila clavipes]